jgi:hypothetical protein
MFTKSYVQSPIRGLLWLKRGREKVHLVGKEQSDAPVVRAKRTGADPHHFAGGAQCIEICGAVTADA